MEVSVARYGVKAVNMQIFFLVPDERKIKRGLQGGEGAEGLRDEDDGHAFYGGATMIVKKLELG